jgi:hypothetical protein
MSPLVFYSHLIGICAQHDNRLKLHPIHPITHTTSLYYLHFGQLDDLSQCVLVVRIAPEVVRVAPVAVREAPVVVRVVPVVVMVAPVVVRVVPVVVMVAPVVVRVSLITLESEPARNQVGLPPYNYANWLVCSGCPNQERERVHSYLPVSY